jgi:uncharacterized protein with PQ loop repeat
MYSLAEYIGAVAVLLTFLGYVPYIQDILRGKTKPHMFSWLVWSVSTGVIAALQVYGGAGAGAWSTCALALLLTLVLCLSFKYGTKDVSIIDIACLLGACCALILWFFTNAPTLAMIVLCAVDMLGFIPTVRKSWNDPHSETLSLYAITTVRHTLCLFALQKYSIVTAAFPVVWIFANGLFSVLLLYRRKVCKTSITFSPEQAR